MTQPDTLPELLYSPGGMVYFGLLAVFHVLCWVAWERQMVAESLIEGDWELPKVA